MSLFRTLQSNPGTISIFGKAPALQNILLKNSTPKPVASSSPTTFWQKIVKGTSKESDNQQPLFVIETLENSVPNHDQLKLLRSITIENSKQNLKVFSQVFPTFVKSDDTTKIQIPEDTESFNQLSSKDWFIPPLVVDWDGAQIANDKESLKQLLSKYREDIIIDV